MLEDLITQGIAYSTDVKGLVGTNSVGIELERWAAQSVMYLEHEFLGSEITEEARIAFKSFRTNTEMKHQQLLGALLAAHEITKARNKSANTIWDLNKD